MAFIIRKHVLFVEGHLKKESFKTTQSDYSHWFGHPAPAKSVIWESMKEFRQTGCTGNQYIQLHCQHFTHEAASSIFVLGYVCIMLVHNFKTFLKRCKHLSFK
jgi:hypothetical protein